jgi:hypothetical protein
VRSSKEAVAELSEPVLVSESTDDAPKQSFIPVEAEVALPDVENADVATIRAAVPEQDAQMSTRVLLLNQLLYLSRKPLFVADERPTGEPTKGEGGATVEEDVSRRLQEVDQSFLVSAGLCHNHSLYSKGH